MSDEIFKAALVVCGLCKGARWVCVAHPAEPSHPGHFHCEDAGTEPCVCNAGPDVIGWPATCQGCSTEEAYMAEHEGEDPEDILAGLDFDLSDEPEATDYSAMSLPEMDIRLEEINAELSDRMELHHKNPPSERGRDLHAERAALIIAQKRKWAEIEGNPPPDLG